MGGGICVGEWEAHLWMLLTPRSSPVGRLPGGAAKICFRPPKIRRASIIYFSTITECNRPPQRPKGPLKVGGGEEKYRKKE
jgi:hypothetical protein